ncbi:MAG: hypothetical protein H6837_18010 [Planctomycetes bacterium]|nr:hypothetical protein [Planctomycetota bacterium]
MRLLRTASAFALVPLSLTQLPAQRAQLLRDITIASPGSRPTQFTRFGNRVAFEVDLPGVGFQPWISDGTAAGTRAIAPSLIGGPTPSALVEVGAELWVITQAGGQARVVATDGSNVVPVATLASGNTRSPVATSAAFGSDLLFTGYVGNLGGLFRLDRGTGNAILLTGAPAADTMAIHVVGQQAIVVLMSSQRQPTVWVTDGSPAGTRVVGTFPHNPGPPEPYWITSFADAVWVSCNSGVVWTDGRTVSTFPALPRGELAVVGDRLFALCANGVYVSDGTAAGTRQVSSLVGSDAAVLGARLLFASGGGLFASDGTAAGTVRLASLALATDWLVTSPEQAWFGGIDAAGRRGLYTTDGTPTGTVFVELLKFWPTTRGAAAVVQGRVFLSLDSAVGIEPFVVDPGAAVERHGAACAGQGTVGVELRADRAFRINAQTVLTGRVTGSTAALLWFGPPVATPLPIPGSRCTAQVDLATAWFLVPLATNAQGAFQVPVPVPNQPSLVGLVGTFQAAFGPSSGPWGIDLSAGAMVRVGR